MLIDTGLIFSVLWDQHPIHVEWECEHPGLPVSWPARVQKLTLCVTFPHVAAYTQHVHLTHHVILTFVDANVIEALPEMTNLLVTCCCKLAACDITCAARIGSLIYLAIMLIT